MTGGALWAAAEAPDLVSGLVLMGVMVAVSRFPVLTHLMTSFLLHQLWGVALYDFYFPKLYPKARPADFEAHRANVKAMLKEPGRLRALRLLFRGLGHPQKYAARMRKQKTNAWLARVILILAAQKF